MFKDKTILVTGGTGSFGNAVVRRLLETKVSEIRVFSRDEKKQDDMRKVYTDKRIKFYIGDVRDYDSIDSAMNGVDYVFSAAALKQVPSCEFFPLEAVKTNILGTENVLNAAIAKGVEKVVVLSTDKAVYPINAMGMSKALMEKVMVAKSRTVDPAKTVMCGTRYGNVIASRGSVVPLFIDQVLDGKHITITDPGMTRFMMSLENAVDLVFFAFTHAQPGDIFVQKAPACTIGNLATAIGEMFGVTNDIKIIGTRHGEKLHESLLNREEMARAEDMGDYFRISADSRDLNYNQYFNAGEKKISREEDYTSSNTRQLDRAGIKDTLMTIEYVQHALKSYKGRK